MEIEKIKELMDAGREAIANDPELKQNFIAVFNTNFAPVQYCETCPGALNSAFDFMEAKYNQEKPIENMVQKNSAFKIKGNGTIKDPKRGKTFGNANLTDEDAFKLLEQSENWADAFSEKPADWQEQLAARLGNNGSKSKSKATEGSDQKKDSDSGSSNSKPLTKKELLAIAKDLKMDMKAADKMNVANLTVAIKEAQAADAKK